MPQESLDRMLWSDMQQQRPPGQLPLLARDTSIGTLERIAQTGSYDASEAWMDSKQHYAIGGRGIEPRLRFTTEVLAPEKGPSLEKMVQRIILARSSTPYRSRRA